MGGEGRGRLPYPSPCNNCVKQFSAWIVCVSSSKWAPPPPSCLPLWQSAASVANAFCSCCTHTRTHTEEKKATKAVAKFQGIIVVIIIKTCSSRAKWVCVRVCVCVYVCELAQLLSRHESSYQAQHVFPSWVYASLSLWGNQNFICCHPQQRQIVVMILMRSGTSSTWWRWFYYGTYILTNVRYYCIKRQGNY